MQPSFTLARQQPRSPGSHNKIGQDLGSPGKDFILASVVGYEVACRAGEMLGTSLRRPLRSLLPLPPSNSPPYLTRHYRIFHTTGTAGTLGASAAVSSLLHLSPSQTLDAFGTAGTQAAGLWEFATDAAMSKQVNTAHAASVGVMSGWTAREGLSGARDVLLGKREMAKGMLGGEGRREKLVEGLGRDWKVEQTSFKVRFTSSFFWWGHRREGREGVADSRRDDVPQYWASCRHTHPSADALLHLLTTHSIPSSSISSVTAHVYRAALDVLEPCEAARSVHESKFSSK